MPTAAAPPPKRLEQAPMATAIPSSAPRPGSAREGVGRRLNAICAVLKRTKPRKKYLRKAVGAKRARSAPTKTPARSPGVIVFTSATSTAPRA